MLLPGEVPGWVPGGGSDVDGSLLRVLRMLDGRGARGVGCFVGSEKPHSWLSRREGGML